ncbi:hypothetical protein FB451DRAFT_1557211 [Mycena latifolia]|nr:hypothetical protein FB451DRAFT_1557211 [Mycena latifolia]
MPVALTNVNLLAMRGLSRLTQMHPRAQRLYSTPRGLGSLSAHRPRRFWDLHVPPETWDYRPRMKAASTPWPTTRPHEREVAVREWISIPEGNLPSPWSCNWACWSYWADPDPLEAVLPARYALGNAPLAPVMFNLWDQSTVFACAATRKFYFYCTPTEWEDCVPKTRRDVPAETMYAFDGVFASVDAFMEDADWNRVELLRAVGEGEDMVPPTEGLRPSALRLNMSNLRVAAHEPYQKRTLWDACAPPGTPMFKPRILDHDCLPERMQRASEWIRIPEAQLPEPWSCDWPKFICCHDWYDGDGGQEEVGSVYGPALAGLVPALFVPLGPLRGDTVLCRPGGAGTYYLWWSQPRSDSGIVWKGAMQRFEGEYASLEHFVRTADWNRLQRVPPCEEEASGDY